MLLNGTAMANPRPPVIVVGMHRSGTTMVTELLHKMGLFVGSQKDGNQEAWFFLRSNDWILRECGGGWDYPAVVDRLFLPENRWIREVVCGHLQARIDSPRVISFLGWRNYVMCRSLNDISFPWGWKDPRNTVTLPIWTRLFPEAKVVHVYRHGVDVAASLVRRRERLKARVQERVQRPPWKTVLRTPRLGFATSVRCARIEDAFELYIEYLLRVRRNLESLSGEYMEIRYEEFVGDPWRYLARLVEFCALRTQGQGQDLERIAGEVRREGAYAYRNRPDLREFAFRVRAALARVGYEA